VALAVGRHLDPQLAQRVPGHPGVGPRLLVGRRRGELHAHLGHREHRADDVGGGQREVPDAGPGRAGPAGHGRDVVLRVVRRLGPEGVRHGGVAGEEGPGVRRSVHQRVPGAVRQHDGGEQDVAGRVARLVQVLDDVEAARPGPGHRRAHVGGDERDVGDRVAVLRDVPAERRPAPDLAGDDEPGGARGEHVLADPRPAGVRAAVGDRAHAERRLVVVRGLLGVADMEPDVVDHPRHERVGGLATGRRDVAHQGLAHR
jgi:hypothetical protein